MTHGINSYLKPNFNIIRVRNNLNVAETVHGTRVVRQEKIYFPQINRSIACAPYDNHFVFEDNNHLGWSTFCSCGSPAVIVGYQVYKNDASPSKKEDDTIEGEMIICHHHATYGRHLDGSS